MATRKQVRATIDRIIRDKDAGIIDGQKAMARLLDALRKDTLARVAEASTEWDAYHSKKYLAAIEDSARRWAVDAASGLAGGQENAWGIGQDLIDKPLYDAGLGFGMPALSDAVLVQMQEFGRLKLSGVADAAVDKIRTELSLGLAGARTPAEVIKNIGRNLKEPSIFRSIQDRALTIYKHEVGKAFSAAGQARMSQAGKTLGEDFRKEWRHAGHPKVARASHLAADGQTVKVDKPYIVGGVALMFPRDPAAPLEDTIGCGCDSSPWHAAWAEVD